jgi:glucokinase-like ROK family protein
MSWAIGIDAGGTKIAGALVSHDGQLSDFECTPVPAKGPPGLEAVRQTARRLLCSAEADGKTISGIGIAVPGAVDVQQGVVLRAPNLNWENVPLKADFEAALGVPVEVELDVRAAALGVMLYDMGRGLRDFVYVTIGTGIGAGIVINGELHYGANSCSGEIGHCVLVQEGPRCNCGQRGCFESLAAGGPIAERAWRIVHGTPVESQMRRDMAVEGRIEPRCIFKAAQAMDSLACEVVRATAEYIGRGLSLLINILNPEKIVIGGGIAKGGEPLLELIRQYTAQYTMHELPKRTDIVLSPDIDNLPVVGAANLVFRRKVRTDRLPSLAIGQRHES